MGHAIANELMLIRESKVFNDQGGDPGLPVKQ